jgi:hypothetical protein
MPENLQRQADDSNRIWFVIDDQDSRHSPQSPFVPQESRHGPADSGILVIIVGVPGWRLPSIWLTDPPLDRTSFPLDRRSRVE